MKSSKNICIYGIAFLLAFVTPTVSLAADKAPSPWKKFSVNAGVFYPAFNSGFRLDSKTLGRGTEIDVEDDLNLDSELSTFRVEAKWRFFPEHQLEFTYYNISRSSFHSPTRTLQFGDQSFTLGFTVATETNIEIYKIAYTWSFLQTRDYELGISIGANVMDTEFKLSAPIVGEEAEAVTAPLPVLGLRGAYAFNPDLVLSAGTDFFYIEYEDFRGRLLDLNVSLEYYFLDHSSLSIGYSFFDVEVTYETDRRNLEFGYTFHGPKAAVIISF